MCSKTQVEKNNIKPFLTDSIQLALPQQCFESRAKELVYL